MAHEFKRLGDVEIAEAISESANVLIEEEGNIKRVSKNNVVPNNVALKSDIPDAVINPSSAVVGQTIVVKAVDETGKPTEWECADMGGQSDWNQNNSEAKDYINNRPFYKTEEKVLLVDAVVSENGWYNVEEAQNLIIGNYYTYIINDIECMGEVYYDDTDGPSIQLFDKEGNNIAYLYGTSFSLFNEYFDLTCPTTIERIDRVFFKIDENYLPSNVSKIDKAFVGQFLCVAAVDENGKPTKWAATRSSCQRPTNVSKNGDGTTTKLIINSDSQHNYFSDLSSDNVIIEITCSSALATTLCLNISGSTEHNIISSTLSNSFRMFVYITCTGLGTIVKVYERTEYASKVALKEDICFPSTSTVFSGFTLTRTDGGAIPSSIQISCRLF